MKIHYQTGIATLIQFITVTLLGIPNSLVSIVSNCHGSNNNCVSNLIPTIAVFILTAFFFAVIWGIGYVAQQKRGRLFSWLLIGAECIVLLAAVINARHYNNILGLLTSLIDMLLAGWIIMLAFRLSRSKGGRIMKSKASRKHTRTPTL